MGRRHFCLSISLLLVAMRTEQPFSALRAKGPRHDPAARPVRRALRRWRSLGAAFVREGGNGRCSQAWSAAGWGRKPLSRLIASVSDRLILNFDSVLSRNKKVLALERFPYCTGLE